MCYDNFVPTLGKLNLETQMLDVQGNFFHLSVLKRTATVSGRMSSNLSHMRIITRHGGMGCFPPDCATFSDGVYAAPKLHGGPDQYAVNGRTQCATKDDLATGRWRSSNDLEPQTGRELVKSHRLRQSLAPHRP